MFFFSFKKCDFFCFWWNHIFHTRHWILFICNKVVVTFYIFKIMTFNNKPQKCPKRTENKQFLFVTIKMKTKHTRIKTQKPSEPSLLLHAPNTVLTKMSNVCHVAHLHRTICVILKWGRGLGMKIAFDECLEWITKWHFTHHFVEFVTI